MNVRRIAHGLVLCAGVLAWLSVLMPYALGLWAYSVLDAWPHYNRPDPKDLGLPPALLGASLLAHLATMYSPAVLGPSIALLVTRRRLNQVQETARKVAIGLYVAGVVAAWTSWMLDPAGVVEWMLD